MKQRYGWISEYQRKKFLDRTSSKDYSYKAVPNKTPSSIAVMLDIGGTTDNIDDTKAKIFISQLELIRKQFGADIGTISISTHFTDYSKITKVLDILSRNLRGKIKIGLSFFYGGTYDYETKQAIPKGNGFNHDKVETFVNYYVNNLGVINKWFAIIDDTIPEETFLSFQNSYPMLTALPSQSQEPNNNFMRIGTTTYGFAGVIEILNAYIESIKSLSPDQVLERQKNMVTHLNTKNLATKFINREYAFIERYFKEEHADDKDYYTILKALRFYYLYSFTKEELLHLQEILASLITYFNTHEKAALAKDVLKLQQALKSKL